MKKPLHNPHSPDVFADAATGFFTFNGNMRITFESIRSDYSQSPIEVDRVVIGRLVMPIGAAEEMAKSILSQIERSKAEPAAEPNATMQ
ncbi:hypothetical protein ACFX5Q_07200 [Mesorhizobium sp. IMUNJ 23033]|uniref:hypothetical protein n=1 Tax=Mesorhizobium sp. IMUNJ 23033 TaxID=3378039 RepID=UPI00384CD6F9